MKKVLVLLALISTALSANAAQIAQVTQTQQTSVGLIRMCVFDDGTYDYCTPLDRQNAQYVAQHPDSVKAPKASSKVQTFRKNMGTALNVANELYNDYRVVVSIFGL